MRFNLYAKIRPLWLLYDRIHVVRRRKELQFFSQFVKNGDLCFDVGACFGSRTRNFLALGAKVVAIEPQEICLDKLRKAFAKIPNVIIVPVGVSNKPGYAQLAVCKDEPAIATISKTYQRLGLFSKYLTYETTQQIRVTTLDALIKKFGVPQFCKIDVEGAEELVIKGLSQPIPIISFEFHKELLPSAKNCVDHLITLGGAKFNCSLGASLKLLFPEWVSEKELLKRLKSISGNIQGDIYARF